MVKADMYRTVDVIQWQIAYVFVSLCGILVVNVVKQHDRTIKCHKFSKNIVYSYSEERLYVLILHLGAVQSYECSRICNISI